MSFQLMQISILLMNQTLLIFEFTRWIAIWVYPTVAPLDSHGFISAILLSDVRIIQIN